jgi:CheY-like chemotaxis protein
MSTTAQAQIDPPEHFALAARPWRTGAMAWAGVRPVRPGVLVLYGEEHANLALADELALEGYEVRRARDPAMLRARCDPGGVDLVLFGRASRRGAGLDVLRELRAGGFAPQVKPGLRTLWMSANGELADVLRAFEAGADDVLRAPFAYPELYALACEPSCDAPRRETTKCSTSAR